MNNSKKTILIVGGFCNSGKSSFLDIAKEFNYKTYSSSDLLHDCYQLISQRFLGRYLDTRNLKDKVIYPFFKNALVKATVREDLIFLAENILVKLFTRSIFVSAIVEKISEEEDENIFIIENIGGEEYRILSKYLKAFFPEANVVRVNIRRAEEKEGIDVRELLPDALEIWNEGDKNFYRSQVCNFLKMVVHSGDSQ